MSNTDLKLYSANEVESARTKGQLVGIIQGAGTIIVLGFVLSLVGWIPMLAAGALVVVVIAKLLSK